jgi:hypothetical protein
MIYSNGRFDGSMAKLFKESPYNENFSNNEPLPPPNTQFLLDNSGSRLLDNTTQPLLVKK